MEAPQAAPKPLILVVDDDSAMRTSLSFLLDIEGFEVRAYSTAGELLADSGVPAGHCLVIDYRLPDMNGLDLLTELRRRRMNQPALIITTYPNKAVRERATLMGVKIVEKPLLTEALFEGIRSALLTEGQSMRD